MTRDQWMLAGRTATDVIDVAVVRATSMVDRDTAGDAADMGVRGMHAAVPDHDRDL